MTKNQKIMIGVGAAVLFCLCACGVAYFAFRSLGQQLGHAGDPAYVSNVADKIAKYDIPPGYSEQMAIDLGLYRTVSLVATEDSTKPMIMLMGYNQSMGVDNQQMQEQLQRSFEQQTGTPGMTWTTVDERKMTIRGQDVNVIIREGQINGGFTLRQLVAVFEGENGTVLIMIQGEAAGWDDDLINEFLASIQ